MMRIEVLGTGCPKCRKLTENVTRAAQELGLECEVAKVTEIADIVARGVMMTPALVVDGEVKLMGKAANAKHVKDLLQ